MLKMTRVSKAYRYEACAIYALRDFSAHVRAGEFVAVTGPSGSGKTTFLTIAGMIECFSGGRYELDGVDIFGMSDIQRSRVRNEKIGFIFQSFNLLDELSVRDNIEMPLRYRGLNATERHRRIQSSLARVGLSSHAGYYPWELSSGQQQLVAIARALAGSPQVLLADEPTSNLGVNIARGIIELLQELRREGSTIVAVTHDAELTRRADREVHLLDGSIVEHPLLRS